MLVSWSAYLFHTFTASFHIGPFPCVLKAGLFFISSQNRSCSAVVCIGRMAFCVPCIHVWLFLVSTQQIEFCHTTCKLNVIRNQKDTKLFRCWKVEVSIYQPLHLNKINENVPEKKKSLLKLVCNPYWEVAVILFASAVEHPHLDKKCITMSV